MPKLFTPPPAASRVIGICSFARIGAAVVCPRSWSTDVTAPTTSASFGMSTSRKAPLAMSGSSTVFVAMSAEETKTTVVFSVLTCSSRLLV